MSSFVTLDSFPPKINICVCVWILTVQLQAHKKIIGYGYFESVTLSTCCFVVLLHQVIYLIMVFGKAYILLISLLGLSGSWSLKEINQEFVKSLLHLDCTYNILAL